MTRGTNISKFKKVYRTRSEGDFPQTLSIGLEKEWDLKYGENPNQHGAIYLISSIAGQNARKMADLTNLMYVRSDGKGKGGLSMTNTMDISRAMDTLKYFDEKSAVAIMKHTIVSGFATENGARKSLVDLFRLARDCDRRSNFGGTVVFNRPVTMDAARALYELKGESPFFVDVLAAPSYEDGVLEYIEGQSKNIRVAEFSNVSALPKFEGDDPSGLVSIKELPGGRVGIQDIFLTRIKSVDDFVLDPLVYDKDKAPHIIENDPTKGQLEDCRTATYLNITGARSNGVVSVRDGVLVSMGAGQVERVGAVEQQIIKGIQKAMDREGIKYDPLFGIQGFEKLQDNPFEGASSSSDAFFPFGDSIELFGRVGVKAIAQPYGSNRDVEVIDSANRNGIAMPATLERCFGHF